MSFKKRGFKKPQSNRLQTVKKDYMLFQIKKRVAVSEFLFKKKQRGKPDMPVIKTYRQRSITQQIGCWNGKLKKNIQVFNKN